MPIEDIKYNEAGLVPAIAQEATTGEVLMLAWMNEESLKLTLETGFAHYFSRSRNKLWKKGETSGNTQKITSLSYDCDADTVLIKVDQTGVACHTGEKNCFFNVIKEDESAPQAGANIIDQLYDVILSRKGMDAESSYVASLLEGGERKVAYRRAPMVPTEIYDAPGKSARDGGWMVDGDVIRIDHVKTFFEGFGRTAE